MLRAIIATAALLLATAAHAGSCTTDTPVNAQNVLQAAQDVWNGGAWDGTGHFAGHTTCPDYDVSDALAVAAALSTPAWLETGERFSLSGGFGFSEGAAALGATGLMRFDKNWSGFVGGAVSTDDSDLWAGRAGVRLGW